MQKKSWAVAAAGVLHVLRHNQDNEKAAGETEGFGIAVWFWCRRFAGGEAEKVV
jgi:hypothetical protein